MMGPPPIRGPEGNSFVRSTQPPSGVMAKDQRLKNRHCGNPKLDSLKSVQGSKYRFGVLLEETASNGITSPTWKRLEPVAERSCTGKSGGS